MSADLLPLLDRDPAAGIRATAALMRERAEAVTSGAQWTNGNYWITDYDPSDPSGQTAMQRLIGGMDAPDHEHYSSWPPAVALAVADWLDAEAQAMEALALFSHVAEEMVEYDIQGAALTVSKSDDGSVSMRADTSKPALAVCRAYLGADQ